MPDPKQPLIEWLKERISAAVAVIGEFLKGFSKDPAHALEWSDDAFEAAAQWRVYLAAYNALTAKESRANAETMCQYALITMRWAAMYPKHSTSMCSHIMHEETAAAWARLHEAAEVILKESEK